MDRVVMALTLCALVAGAPGALAEGAAPGADPAPPGPEGAPGERIADAPAAPAPWCAPELATLPDDVCVFTPDGEGPGPRTLVFFLHGVIQPDSGWQWAQQRAAARAGSRHGLTVLMPRGRRGVGPASLKDWWTWPTSAATQRGHEDAIVAEWGSARAEIERRAGRPFDRALVFGFSNGAYYATSLALRGRLPVQGYAVFAGGSGAAYLERAGAATAPGRRAPLFVAWGAKDPSHHDQVSLSRMLSRLHWPSLSMGLNRAGHAMTDSQVEAAVRFLAP